MKYFNYKQFNLKELIDLKKKSGITVGLALPVRNEEKTIRKIILSIKKCKNLIDELIVIDSCSSDNSKKICKKLGVKVVNDKNAARDIGIRYSKGKGWNLWASLYYLNTDIIIWMDTDIKNINERFIIGLIGPLLADRKIKFVKGYYRRPKKDARVTEIMVRPFINLIFPEAKNFIQPLSGEYGGRRNFLEKVYFYSGYSVEIAILIQALHKLHKSEIAQSYLGKRIHDLQDVLSLGKMSASILNTLFDIAKNMGCVSISKNPSPVIRQFISKDSVNFSSVDTRIADKRLPLMIKVKKYVHRITK